MKILKNRLLIFLPIFIIGIIISAITQWNFFVSASYEYFYKANKHYLSKHEKNIRKEIFGEIFPQAKRCVTVSSPTHKTQCEKEVTHHLAISIIEEDFLDKEGYGWPTDLFFVKQEGSKYSQLGWDGKYSDITKNVNPALINLPYNLRLFTHQCHIFYHEEEVAPTCELYEKISLGKNSTGYLVRRSGVTEETRPELIILFFPLMALNGISGLFQGRFQDASYFAIPAIQLIVTIIVAGFVSTKASEFAEKKEKKAKR